ncbi:unnamed protein product [Orchesella dallaii]|uniref:Glycolipid transfer protein domain-containing protein n=1 Tax=Orchesella dallaii TaxID=48710 RepID=A0ABP1RG26_9HEXA
MDNNNSSVESMGSQEQKTKGHTPTIEEVDADGQFSGHFNIKLLNEHLKRCIREGDGEVDMDEYIKIFQQLYKFFCMLGTVFGFIGSDVKSKIEILQGHRNGENTTHYETVEKMITFEKTTDYIHSNKETSGSRTFLRLHRSLIFVSMFLGKMDSIGDQDGISRICKDAYAQTLAKFHPWLIQKGAGIAMLGLPTKKDLILKVSTNGPVESNEVGPLMQDVIRRTHQIYDQCEELYTKHDLHSLP